MYKTVICGVKDLYFLVLGYGSFGLNDSWGFGQFAPAGGVVKEIHVGKHYDYKIGLLYDLRLQFGFD